MGVAKRRRGMETLVKQGLIGIVGEEITCCPTSGQEATDASF
jgi:hypothetical protein